MSIGAQSPLWRRVLLKSFSSTYFRRTIRTDDGTFESYVSPGSSLKVLRPHVEIEPAHRRFIRDWIVPDSVVWDIGANLGLFLFPAALKAAKGRVFGFEPDVELAANLIRSARLRRNKNLDISVLSVALSNREGTAVFQISKFSRALNKLEDAGVWHDAQVAVQERRPVLTTRVDHLSQSLAPPTVMKIDVEGAEIQVLEGSVETIAKHRPVMLVEGPRTLRDAMGAFFRQHDYVLFDGASEARVALEGAVWDTVAVPRERSASYARV